MTTRLLIHAALMLLTCTALATPLQLRWTAELSDPKPYQAVLFAGESADLVATLKLYGRPVALETNATASLYWQTNGMGSAWWQSPATVTTAGVVTASWTPAMDAGADLYRWHIGVANAASSTIYRAFGAFRMQPAPGAVPNQLPLPTPSIDFSLVDIKNAPWLTAENDPVAGAALAGHTAASNPHGITAEGIGALPARLDGVTYNLDGGYWFQLYNPYARALLTTSTLQFFTGSTMTLGVDSESIRINGRNYFWPAKAQDETLLTESDIYGLASKSYVDSSFVSKAYVDTTFPTKSYVESTRWQADDIATDVVYHVVVSNGHWLIREVQ